jgi:hypothetical protein
VRTSRHRVALLQNANGTWMRRSGAHLRGRDRKIARKADSPSITHGRLGQGVQQALLKILEGTIATSRRRADGSTPAEYVQVAPRTLFICGGAFVAWTDRGERVRGAASGSVPRGGILREAQVGTILRTAARGPDPLRDESRSSWSVRRSRP